MYNLLSPFACSWWHLHCDKNQGCGDGGGARGPVLPAGSLQRVLCKDRGGDPGAAPTRPHPPHHHTDA